MPQDVLEIPFIPALFSSRRGNASIDMLTLHYTDGPSLEHCVGLFRSPEHPVSCHYIVGLDGHIVQMVYDRDCAWHCGKSRWRGRERCNPWSIGVEIVNWGKLKYDGAHYYTWPDNYSGRYTGAPPAFADGEWWASYPAIQVERVIALSSALVEKYRIPYDNLVRHSDIAPDRKIDPGPAFPWENFLDAMQKTINGRW
jgi:N-acetylmuramoyl-L-alanine amidase